MGSVIGSFDASAVSAIGERASELTFSQLLAFQHIHQGFILDNDALIDFLIAQRAPVVERPDFWVRLINDDEIPDAYRGWCVRMFYLRHLQPGDSPAKLASIEGTKDWFTEKTVQWQVVASAVPLSREPAGGAYGIVPASLEGLGMGVYIQFSKSVEPEDLLLILTSESHDDRGLRVIDVTVDSDFP